MGSRVAWVGVLGAARPREALVLSLRLIAAFGAVATAVTLLGLSLGVPLPFVPLALVVPWLVARPEPTGDPERAVASIALGAVATTMFAGDAMLGAPTVLGGGWISGGWIAVTVLASGAAVAVLSRVGLSLASRSRARVAASRAGHTDRLAGQRRLPVQA